MSGEAAEVCPKQSTIQAAHSAPVRQGDHPEKVHRLTLQHSTVEGSSENFMGFSRFLPIAALVAAAVLITGCEENAGVSSQTQYLGGIYGNQPTSNAPTDTVSYWDGDHVGGKPSIKISLAEQRAYFYRSGILVGISQLSTGREGKNTPIGHFSILNKDRNHVSSMYGDFVDGNNQVVKPNVAVSDPKPAGSHFKGAPMPFYMQIAPGFGLHAGYLPGYPASHGCIRMPEFMAENFFKSVSSGTPVTITN